MTYVSHVVCMNVDSASLLMFGPLFSDDASNAMFNQTIDTVNAEDSREQL